MAKKQINIDDELLSQQENEFIANLSLEDDEFDDELETSFDRETCNYDFDVDDNYSKDEVIMPATQLNDCISLTLLSYYYR